MAWDDLRYLEAVARHRSIAHAARELGVAPSTVYRRIAELESEVGAPCIVRGETPPALTETGRSLAALAREVRTSMQRITVQTAEARQSVEGRVSLTTVEGFLPFLLDPWRTLAARHPGLALELHLADDGPSVWRREVDIAIAVVANPPEGLIGRRLAPVRYGVFGTAQTATRPDAQWILGAAPASAHGIFERAHAGDVALITQSRHAVVRFVREGFGVALLPRRIAGLHGLVERTPALPGLADLDRRVWLLTHPDQRDVARVRVVLDELTDALGEASDPGARDSGEPATGRA